MISGEVLYVDRFGNLITNIPSEAVSPATGEAVVMVARKRLCKVQAAYGAVPPGRFVAVNGSTGFLEIAVNLGNAAKRLNLRTGAKIRVQLFT
jgi:S-adenosylmethionine hydrolase